MSKRYFWLKLQKDFFDSKRIKKLRKLAGGDTYTIIYLKMQLLSLDHDGILEYTGLEKTFAEELALDIDEDPENVAVTLNYLISCGLVETSDNIEYFLPFVTECTGSENASAQRVRDYRKRQRALQCNTDVTPVKPIGNVEIEKEIEIDKEIEIEKRESIPYQRIADTYNTICTSYPSLTSLSENRKKAIRARLNSGYSEEDFTRVFEMAEESDFLKGKNDRNWSATFDWMIKDANMAKILDGNYANKSKTTEGNVWLNKWAEA